MFCFFSLRQLRAFCKRILKLLPAQLSIGTLVSLVVVVFIFDCVDFLFFFVVVRARVSGGVRRLLHGIFAFAARRRLGGPTIAISAAGAFVGCEKGTEKGRQDQLKRIACAFFKNYKKKRFEIIFIEKRRRTVGSDLQRKTVTTCGEIAGRTSGARTLFAGVLGLDFFGAALAIGAAGANISCGNRGTKREGRTFFSSKNEKKQRDPKTTRSKKD